MNEFMTTLVNAAKRAEATHHAEWVAALKADPKAVWMPKEDVTILHASDVTVTCLATTGGNGRRGGDRMAVTWKIDGKRATAAAVAALGESGNVPYVPHPADSPARVAPDAAPEAPAASHYFGSTAFDWAKAATRAEVLQKLAKAASTATIKENVKHNGGLYAWTVRVMQAQSEPYAIAYYRPEGVPTESPAEFLIQNARGESLPTD